MRNAQLAHRGEQAARDALAVGLVRAVQHRHQFFAAVTRDEIERPAARGIAQRARNAPQAVVAGDVAVAVVVGLEAVDVDHDDRDRLAVALRLLPDAADLVFEGRAIEQRGEAVVRRDFGELAMLEEGGAIRVFQRVRAGEADDVGARTA